MTTVAVSLVRLSHGEGLALPAYATIDSAGLDIAAAVSGDVVLLPGDRAAIPTGWAVVLPAGFEAQIRPRSGLALRHGVTVLNSPGTVDADYRGEVKVILINHGPDPYTVRRGDRIAQMVIAPIARATIAVGNELPETERSANGFGSTGVGRR
ncbi:MAG: dUTP diphosphatase [Alphaproteobacteria bacterium]|nr:dUTP diphosphatase [Alphaproteobacteria bacterium]